MNVPNTNIDPLRNLIAGHESWLLERVVQHAGEHDYLKYTATLKEAWRLAITGLSAALMEGLQTLYPNFELTAREDYTQDPVSSFAITENGIAP